MDVSLDAEGAIEPEGGGLNEVVPGHVIDGLDYWVEGEERLDQFEEGGHRAWVDGAEDDDRLASWRLECQIEGERDSCGGAGSTDTSMSDIVVDQGNERECSWECILESLQRSEIRCVYAGRKHEICTRDNTAVGKR